MLRVQIKLTLLFALLLVVLGTAACGSESESSDNDAEAQSAVGSSVNAAAREQLPEGVRSSGELKVATSLQWPPFGFKGDDGQPTGLDIDMMNAVAARLGLKATFSDVKFDAIIPAVSNDRFDVGVNEVGDTAERRKQVDFVDYYDGGYVLLVPKGQDSGISAKDLCGHTLGVTQGSNQLALAQDVSKACTADGKPAIDLKILDDSAGTILAVANGRVEGMINDAAVSAYLTSKQQALEVLPGVFEGTEFRAGMVVAKDNNALSRALQTALQSMMDDGSYEKIFANWGVADQARAEATLNDETN